MNSQCISTAIKMFVIFIVFYFNCFGLIAQSTPKKYIAFKSFDKFDIDGKANEPSWQKSKWSENFVDIEGKKNPKYQTRMKMLWDEKYLYIYAELMEPHVWGNLKERDTIIFYNNDFEIFIDPDGDTHNYYEFEMNALNTIWDLYLSKPYRNQGAILDAWDFKNLLSAVHINGTLNDPSDVDRSWSVEIAIPWSFKTEPGRKTSVPENKYWRINFSRVNWDFQITKKKYYRKQDPITRKFMKEKNWVWSPQGVINMHEPEHWGYVYFTTAEIGSDTKFTIPKDEHIKWFLYEIYRAYLKNEEVTSALKSKIIFKKHIEVKINKNAFGWDIWTVSPFTNQILTISDDGKFESIKQE